MKGKHHNGKTSKGICQSILHLKHRVPYSYSGKPWNDKYQDIYWKKSTGVTLLWISNGITLHIYIVTLRRVIFFFPPCFFPPVDFWIIKISYMITLLLCAWYEIEVYLPFKYLSLLYYFEFYRCPLAWSPCVLAAPSPKCSLILYYYIYWKYK